MVDIKELSPSFNQRLFDGLPSTVRYFLLCTRDITVTSGHFVRLKNAPRAARIMPHLFGMVPSHQTVFYRSDEFILSPSDRDMQMQRKAQSY
jgi:hypothetical protein